jgi:hypothetical protein
VDGGGLYLVYLGLLPFFGLFLTIFWLNAPRWLTTGIYLGMGWMVIIAVYPMIVIFQQLGAFHSLFWLLLGGLFYTIGGVLYGLKWPKLKNKYFSFHDLYKNVDEISNSLYGTKNLKTVKVYVVFLNDGMIKGFYEGNSYEGSRRT